LVHRAAAYLAGAAQGLEGARLQVLEAPKVLKRPHTVTGPTGDGREDPYYWLRDDERQNPEVLEHLKVGGLPACQHPLHSLSPAVLTLIARSSFMHACRLPACM
jgi:hypothetical protein